MADPTFAVAELAAACEHLKQARIALRSANATAGPVAGLILVPAMATLAGLNSDLQALLSAMEQEVRNG